jgi:hypothetical protein
MGSTRLLAFSAVVLALGAALVTALPAGAKTAGNPTWTFSTATNEINSGAFNQGYWAPTLSNTNSNTNYEVGKNESGRSHRNFFTFSLTPSPFACTPSSAVLHIASGEGNQAAFSLGPTSLTYDLYDVTTDPVTLNGKNANPNPAIYSDLGSGTIYGSYTLSTVVSNTTFNLALNPNALYDLGVAKQFGASYFSIGGAIVPDPAASYNFLFGFTGGSAATLTVTYPRLCKVSP